VQDLIREALALPVSALPYHLTEGLAGRYPELVVVESSEDAFEVEPFAGAGLCVLRPCPDVCIQRPLGWLGPEDGVGASVGVGAFEVLWDGHTMPAVKLTWQDGVCTPSRWWVCAPDEAVGRAFFGAVARWNTEVRGEVLVFHGGEWAKDAALFEAIRAATFEEVVLAPELASTLLRDFEQFFASEEVYRRHAVPWKRGALFLGPPGNGKTHTLKALVQALGRPCLYVKSFKSRFTWEHENVRRVFQRARQAAPCLLVLEDLDSLLNDDNRAFFLNEMDGFAENTGIVVLATTNHPDRLDPAILERPSRFDRKYHFPLPAVAERRTYVRMWNQRLAPEARLSEAGMERVAGATDGFSFAYLKELFLSSMMRWIAGAESGAMDNVMLDEAANLERQRRSGVEAAAAPVAEDGEAPWPVISPFPQD